MMLFLIFIVLVNNLELSDSCPTRCQCNKYKTFCSLARLEKIPTGLSPSTELLRVEYDNIKEINKNSLNAMDLQDLKSLQLLNVNLTSIEAMSFKGMDHLESLKISKNNITELKSDTFIGLDKLSYLDLTENKLISLVRGAFKGLSMLRHLFLSRNLITQLQSGTFHGLECGPNFNFDFRLRLYDLQSSTDIQKYSVFNISSLELISNNFPELYRNTFMGFRSVKSLTLGGCNITKIEPYAFLEMNELRELNLTGNRIKKFEVNTFKGLKNVRTLDLSNLQVVPKFSFGAFRDLINLRTLYLHRNNIYSVFHPDIFMELIELKEIYLQHNQLIDLPQGLFRNLLSIEKIDLRFNEIHRLIPGIFGAICDDFMLTCANLTQITKYCNTTNALTKLRYLDLSANSITYIHPHTFISCTNLELLNLNFNRALTLKNDFLYLPNLRNLLLFDCNITEISNTSFQCSTHLEVLFIDSNKIEKLRVNQFRYLTLLKYIALKQNPIKYDCGVLDTWAWFRNKNVKYVFDDNFTDSILTMNCNGTVIHGSSHEMYEDIYHYFKLYIEPIVFIIIFLSGLLGNGVILFITFRYPEMRTRQNAPITHLAAVDIICLILNLPLSYWDVVHESWDLGLTTCKLFLAAKDMIVGVFIYSLIIISYERFLVIRISYYLKKLCGTSVSDETLFYLVIVWIFALITTTPIYFTATVNERCLYSQIENSVFILHMWTYQFIIYCIIPTICIIFLNVTAAYTLRKSIRDMPGEKLNNMSKQAKNRASVSNMVVIFSIVFTISYFPNYLLRMLVSWSVYVPEDVFLTSFFTFCLFFCNSTISPFIFLTMNPKYKSYLMRYIHDTKAENKKVPDILVSVKCENISTQDAPVSEDELARRARMERLARLQKRFM
ncbi:hypothetical protein C0J52_23290 [Blattella germanica]|nr:hypothetical protein C0J52_23290 [Blattella germanica]